MNLLLLAKSTPVHRFGGMETHTESVARAARELGHEVVLITTSHPQGLQQEVRDGIRVEYLPGTPPAQYSRIWWTESVAAIGRWLDRGFGDLLLSFSLAGYGAAVAGVPIRHYAFAYGEGVRHLISEWHDSAGARGLIAYPKRALAQAYPVFLEWRLWRRLHGIVATYDALYVAARQRGYTAHLSYNGIDVDQFTPHPTRRDAMRRALGIDPSAQLLLMVGTANRQKGLWLGAESFLALKARHPDLRLLVVGDGPDLPWLRARLETAADHVRLVGAVPQADLPAFYASSDVFVYPTLRMEGLPLAILYALAAALPVVASDRGGIRSAIKDGETGILVPPGDRRALALAVERVLDDPFLAGTLGKRGRELACADFDARSCTARLLAELTEAP